MQYEMNNLLNSNKEESKRIQKMKGLENLGIFEKQIMLH